MGGAALRGYGPARSWGSRALEVRLGGGQGTGTWGTRGAVGCEKERGKTESCAGFGEREESDAMGGMQHGLETSGHGGEVVPALGLVSPLRSPSMDTAVRKKGVYCSTDGLVVL